MTSKPTTPDPLSVDYLAELAQGLYHRQLPATGNRAQRLVYAGPALCAKEL